MTNIKFDFSNKTAVITGGAQGIGFEIARSFLQTGAQVILWDYSEDALKSARAELSAFKNKVHCQVVNVGDRNSLATAVAALPTGVDILVNNAGITRDKSFSKLSPEDWDSVIQVNLTGLFNVTKALLEKFSTTHQSRRIINISSVVGLYGNFGQANYAAAKAGVIGFTKTLGKELGRKGFTVNAIAPGFIRTAMTNAMPKETLEQMAAKVPVKRLGETHEIAHAVMYLASDEASYVNSTVLSVDGGIVL